MKDTISTGKKITSIIITISIFAYSALSIGGLYFGSKKETDGKTGSTAEEEMISNVYKRDEIVDIYGFLQRLMLKNEENAFDIVRDRQGYLHSGNFWNEFYDIQKESAVRVKRLFMELEEKGTKTGFIMAPMKTVKKGNKYLGIPYNDFNSAADSMLRNLRYYSIPVLDLRSELKNSSLSYEEIFFKTDSIWKTEAAFFAYGSVLDWIKSTYGEDLNVNGKYTDLANYYNITASGAMLGSQARRAGKGFGGDSEDISFIIPNEGGNYIFESGKIGKTETKISGGFLGTLLQGDIYSQESNTTSIYDRLFLGGTDEYTKIINIQNETAPKILLIRDSYASSFACFLAQNFSQTDLIHLLDMDTNELEEFLEDKEYDYVFFMLYPENLTEDNFNFYKSRKNND